MCYRKNAILNAGCLNAANYAFLLRAIKRRIQDMGFLRIKGLAHKRIKSKKERKKITKLTYTFPKLSLFS